LVPDATTPSTRVGFPDRAYEAAARATGSLDPMRARETFWVETLGCPKNAVDSDKVVASLIADGLVPATEAGEADLVVVNTCAFVEDARRESIDAALALSDARKPGARLVVTGCMAERYGAELGAALPEADAVVGFAGEGSLAAAAGTPVRLLAGRRPTGDRRGLRPAVRVLCDPVVPRPSAISASRCDRGRGP
jgi:hypothetical protein